MHAFYFKGTIFYPSFREKTGLNISGCKFLFQKLHEFSLQYNNLRIKLAEYFSIFGGLSEQRTAHQNLSKSRTMAAWYLEGPDKAQIIFFGLVWSWADWSVGGKSQWYMCSKIVNKKISSITLKTGLKWICIRDNIYTYILNRTYCNKNFCFRCMLHFGHSIGTSVNWRCKTSLLSLFFNAPE